MADKEREPTEEEKKKTLAEIKKLDAETRKFADDEQRAKEQDERSKAEHALTIRRLEAEAKQFEYLARMGEMEKIRHEYAFNSDMAADVFKHVYRFTSSVGESSVKDCINRLVYWDRLEPGCDVQIIFTSPGGSVIDGLVLFDHIQDFKQRGHKVTTSTFGWAASMAGILLQVGDHRVMRKEAWLLIHEVSFGTSGKIGEIEDTVNWVKRIQERVLDIFEGRCKDAAKAGTASAPLTKAQLKKHWMRTDWWISSEEALKHGLVDEVL